MSDFSLYEKLLDQHTKKTELQSCNHNDAIIHNGIRLCIECGVELKEPVHIVKSIIDPSRCYIRKIKNKSIYDDVKHMNISDHIKDMANTIYTQVCGNTTHRGTTRRGIVFGAIFHSYKLDKNPQSCDSLIKQFRIKRKDALKGLKFINEHAPSNSPLRTTYITPEHLIHEFLGKFNVSCEKKKEIFRLYEEIKGTSSILNRSRPQSVAAGIIYYYIQLTDRHIDIKDFVKQVNLSELTIHKISKEISRIRQTTDLI